MEYVSKKKKEMAYLLRTLASGEKLMLLDDDVYYNKNEIEMKINRVQRQIDGYKRVQANLNNNSMTMKEYALFKSLAIKEHEHYLEVENKIDSFISDKLMSKMTKSTYENTFELIKNLNKRIANRSRVVNKNLWIGDRTFELASVGDIVDFELVPESFYNINHLDCLMSGKISKDELEKAGLWRVIHENHTNSIYKEAGGILRSGKSQLTFP